FRSMVDGYHRHRTAPRGDKSAV
ncbi:hypothetical protein, partial [Salmonella enterica]